MTSAVNGLRIVSPANNALEIPLLAAAGADEVYCGVLPAGWIEEFGDWDCLSRRQGTVANLPGLDEMRKVAQAANGSGMASALALNVRYTECLMEPVLDVASEWERAGGTAVIASSPALFIGLRNRGSRLRFHASLMANIANRHALEFFRDLGVSRVILPRELTLPEMAAVTRECPDMEFEAMALNEKCRFVDGLCGFYHGTSLTPDSPTDFPYTVEPDGHPVAGRQDLAYAGHGCRIPFTDRSGRRLFPPGPGHATRPACAACALDRLRRSGAEFLKIGGRGTTLQAKTAASSFLRACIANANEGDDKNRHRRSYFSAFGVECEATDCYYPEGR